MEHPVEDPQRIHVLAAHLAAVVERRVGERLLGTRLEIDLDQFLAREPKPAQWKPTSRQPSSDLDLAFEMLDSIAGEYGFAPYTVAACRTALDANF